MNIKVSEYGLVILEVLNVRHMNGLKQRVNI